MSVLGIKSRQVVVSIDHELRILLFGKFKLSIIIMDSCNHGVVESENLSMARGTPPEEDDRISLGVVSIQTEACTAIRLRPSETLDIWLR